MSKRRIRYSEYKKWDRPKRVLIYARVRILGSGGRWKACHAIAIACANLCTTKFPPSVRVTFLQLLVAN